MVLIRVRVGVLSDSLSCAGKHSRDPSEIWPYRLSQVWNGTDLLDKRDLSCQEMQFT